MKHPAFIQIILFFVLCFCSFGSNSKAATLLFSEEGHQISVLNANKTPSVSLSESTQERAVASTAFFFESAGVLIVIESGTLVFGEISVGSITHNLLALTTPLQEDKLLEVSMKSDIFCLLDKALLLVSNEKPPFHPLPLPQQPFKTNTIIFSANSPFIKYQQVVTAPTSSCSSNDLSVDKFKVLYSKGYLKTYRPPHNLPFVMGFSGLAPPFIWAT